MVNYTDLKQEAYRKSVVPDCPFVFLHKANMMSEAILDDGIYYHYDEEYKRKIEMGGWDYDLQPNEGYIEIIPDGEYSLSFGDTSIPIMLKDAYIKRDE